MSNSSNLERRSAQAILATYMQMTRYGELARHLQKTRERSLEQRMRQTADLDEASRLQRQLEAQQGQSMALDSAMEHLQGRAPELASFAEAGLTYDDFKVLGLENVVQEEDVKAAQARAEERRKQAEEQLKREAEAKAKRGKKKAAKAKAKPAPVATSAAPATPPRTRSAQPHPPPTINVDIPERPTAEDDSDEIGKVVPPEALAAVAHAEAEAARAAIEAAANPEPETDESIAVRESADTQPDLAPMVPELEPEGAEPDEPTESDD